MRCMFTTCQGREAYRLPLLIALTLGVLALASCGYDPPTPIPVLGHV